MILIVTQTFAPAKGGMEAYMTGLAEHLAAAGYKTTVFADAAKEPYAPQESYALTRFGGWRPLRRWKKRRAISSLAEHEAIEGIFCDSWKSVEALPKETAAPIAVFAHGSEYPTSPSDRKNKRITQALSRCASIIANSVYTANAVRAFFSDANDQRLIVINPPVSPIPSASKAATARIRELINGRSPVISTLARLEPRKGVDRVISALPDIIKNHPKAVFLIGGDGEDKNRLHSLAEKLGVLESVIFHGWVEDLDTKAAILSQSDIFAMPSYRVGSSVEGFGIVYVEAAWFGVPAVAGNDGGAADAVTDGETGILCNGNAQTEITDALTRLLHDTELRNRMSAAAKIQARELRTWTTTLPRMLSALNISAAKRP